MGLAPVDAALAPVNDDDDDEEEEEDEEGGFTANTGGSWLKHPMRASARGARAWLKDDQLRKYGKCTTPSIATARWPRFT